MDCDPYIARAKAAVEAAQKKQRTYQGDCSDCRYSYSAIRGRCCAHPAVELVSFNLTDGYAKGRILECAEQRDEGSVWGPVVCGPDGALFEKREKPLSFLARLFGAAE